jgi:hypothetical protein
MLFHDGDAKYMPGLLLHIFRKMGNEITPPSRNISTDDDYE